MHLKCEEKRISWKDLKEYNANVGFRQFLILGWNSYCFFGEEKSAVQKLYLIEFLKLSGLDAPSRSYMSMRGHGHWKTKQKNGINEENLLRKCVLLTVFSEGHLKKVSKVQSAAGFAAGFVILSKIILEERKTLTCFLVLWNILLPCKVSILIIIRLMKRNGNRIIKKRYFGGMSSTVLASNRIISGIII